MSTAVATAVEMLQFAPESRRALALFAALTAEAKAHGVETVSTTTYRGNAPWLLLWGPGAPVRAAVLEKHVAAGGRAICWDLAYYDRERKARVSFDAAHPSAWVMRKDHSPARFIADRVPVSDDWNPNGPILIAGLGDKARVQYGSSVVDPWEAAKMRDCVERWPTRPILYRRKKVTSPTPSWATCAPFTPIEDVLKGKSLVITWHSNVAVDAIRMGIPVVCKDGAAAAVCPSEVPAVPTPLPTALRDKFLTNLAWFQWGNTPQEAAGFWKFAQEMLA